jgi:hypothetical protein
LAAIVFASRGAGLDSLAGDEVAGGRSEFAVAPMRPSANSIV